MRNITDSKGKKKVISAHTIRRIPMYLFYLKSKQSKEVEFITAPIIGNELNVDSTQIRKDFAEISIKGKTKVGYNIDDVIEKIEWFLGYHIHRKAFIVGVGNLGTALINFKGFYTEGIEIIKGFDIDIKKIGNKINGVEIYDISTLQDHFILTPIDVGIITVPSDQAQQVVDIMIESGMTALWNFSTMPISAPTNIIIENTCIDSSLALIKWKLQNETPLIYKNRML